jgi:hypothetical protein
MESRNGGEYAARADVAGPSATINGRAGDELRVYVIAVGANGGQSPPSTPSPTLRFHAAIGTPAAATRADHQLSGGLTIAIESTSASSSRSETTRSEAAPSEAAPSEAADEDGESTNDAGTNSDGAESEAEATALVLGAAAREQLLRADARIPVLGLSTGAEAWLHARADEQLVAGLQFAGTGRLDSDELSELIWADPAGQLFVATGAAILESAELETTLEEAIRLRATERFVALADVDGDGRGDWLIEDTATGEIWLIDDTSQQARAVSDESADGSAMNDAASTPARLVGHGDFDGDGRTELLWQHEDQSLHLGRGVDDGGQPTLPLPALPRLPTIPAERLLTIADLDGDGRDDLVARGEEGGLELTLMLPDGPEADATTGVVSSETFVGAGLATVGFELIASLDLDGDGRPELVWLDGDRLAIQDPLADTALGN